MEIKKTIISACRKTSIFSLCLRQNLLIPFRRNSAFCSFTSLKLDLFFIKHIVLLKSINAIQLFFVCVLFFSCNNNDKNDNNSAKDTLSSNGDVSIINIISPKPLSLYTIGDKIEIKANISNDYIPDSSFILLNNKVEITNFKTAKNTINTDSCHTGNNSVQIVVWNNGKQHVSNVTILLKSNVIPEKFTYKVIKAYSHDSKSYTQGLIYENGFIYEGTGQYGESTLQKYKLQNSELIQSYNLPEDVFGEGIVVYKNKIYQRI